MLPVWPLHHSEEYFPEPEKFKPERFLKENSADVVPFTFRPFGGGNRECIGRRFAMNEMKNWSQCYKTFCGRKLRIFVIS
jgi:cytochrome P450